MNNMYGFIFQNLCQRMESVLKGDLKRLACSIHSNKQLTVTKLNNKAMTSHSFTINQQKSKTRKNTLGYY